MSCLTTNPVSSSEYLPVIDNDKLNNNESGVDQNADSINDCDQTMENNGENFIKIENSKSPTNEAITCDINEFNRPTTPPASTPSPTQTKNINKRKIKNQFLGISNYNKLSLTKKRYKKINLKKGNALIKNSDDMEDIELENDEELEDEELQEEEESQFIPEEEIVQGEIEPNTEKDSNLDDLAENDNEIDLSAVDENNNCVRDLNEISKYDSKEIKEILELNNRMDSEFSNDMIVCGKCNTDFQLSEIVLFIEHKASKCIEPKASQKMQSNS